MNVTPWRRRESMLPARGGLTSMLPGLFDPVLGWEPLSRLPELFRDGPMPALNVSETDKELTVTVELPGLDEDDINVSLEGDRLVVSGERKWSEEKKDEEYHRIETQYGRFSRSVMLPDGLQTDARRIEARYDKGMLTVVVPKLEPSPAHKIKVRKS